MALSQTRESVIATKHPLRYRIFVAVAGVVLSAAALGGTSASATLPGEVEGTAKSIAPPVTAPVAASLPSVPSIPAPSVPPAVPQVPAQTPAPSPSSSPAPAPSSSTTRASNPVAPVADAPSVGGVTGSAKKVAAVPSTPKEAAKQVTSPVRGSGAARPSGHGTSASTADVGASGGDALISGTARRKPAAPSAPPSIRPAKVAPLRQWFARIWPAIELGGNGAVLAQLEGARPLTVFDAARLFLLGITLASSEPTPSGHLGAPNASLGPNASPRPNASLGAPNNSLVPGGREITLFVIISFAALLALLASTVWVELRARYR
jgi:hypothetical protein